MPKRLRTLTHDDYTIGWICALPKTELVVAEAMLDEEHSRLAAAPNDMDSYILGRVGFHNIVIASFPAAKIGTVTAAVVAKDMLRSFKAVRFGLMVGIGGGAPLYNDPGTREAEDEDTDEDGDEGIRDIRLGDVVISLPSKVSQAVVQYDFGKSMQGGRFVRDSTLNNPPNIVRSAVSLLQARQILKGNGLSERLSQMFSENPAMPETFKYPGADKDRLFKANIVHVDGKKNCNACCGPLNVNLVKRKNRKDQLPMLHYGTIGSADQVMKDSILRDKMGEG